MAATATSGEEFLYRTASMRTRRRAQNTVVLALVRLGYTFLWIAGVIKFDRHQFLQPYVLPIVMSMLVVNWYVYATRCPRCGKSFFATCLTTSFFAIRCPNCGLPKGAPRAPDREAAI